MIHSDNLVPLYLETLTTQVLTRAALGAGGLLIGAVGAWFYINSRGKKLGLDWLTLHQWRMAALLLGPLAAIAFYFWSKVQQRKSNSSNIFGKYWGKSDTTRLID
jgi:hypothetical protein